MQKKATTKTSRVVTMMLWALTANACGGESTTIPTDPTTDPSPEALIVLPVEDQVVLRNTTQPRSVTLSVELQEGPSDFFIDVVADDPSVLATELVRCTTNPCDLALTPAATATASTAVTLQVESDGREGSTVFQLSVVPRLVTDPGDDGAGTLRAVVAGVEAGDVVAFDTEGAFATPQTVALSSAVELSRDVTIEGPGAAQVTLQGPDGALLLTATALARVQGVSVRDGLLTDRGRSAITLDPGTHLILQDAVVAANEAPLGGAIHVADATLDLGRTAFEGNGAEQGGAVYLAGGTLRVGPGTTFTGNQADVHGGAVAATNGLVEVDGATLGGPDAEAANLADSEGGALWATGSEVVVRDATLQGNSAFAGGAVAVLEGGRLEVTDSTFDGNSSTGDGGAVLTSNVGEHLVTTSQFLRNESSTSSGGALSLLGDDVDATIEGCTFSENKALFLGAALRTSSALATVDLSDSTFALNEAPFGIVYMHNGSVDGVDLTSNTVDVGVLWLESGTVAVSDTTISGNTATDYAPGLFLSAVTVTVTGGSIADNLGPEGNNSYGGGVLASSATATFDGVEIARNTGGRGAGLYVGFGSVVTLNATTVAENGGLQVSGAGAYVDDGGTLVLDQGTEIRANTTLETGGGVLVQVGAELEARDAAIGGPDPADGNESPNGGGIFNIGSVILSDDTVIRHNRANLGGGIFQAQSAVGPTQATLGGATIRDNEADSFGGGIYLVGDTNVTAASDVTISGNTVATSNGGGGLYRAGPFSDFFACDFPVSRVVSNLDDDGEIDNVQPSPGGCF